MSSDPGLPRGTVTFLFTDIEGSTELLKRLGRDRYESVLAEHAGMVRAAVAAYDGRVVDTQGDSLFCVFRAAREGVLAAVEAQRELASGLWPEQVEVRVRMGLHSGEPKAGEERYVGIGVHRAARIGAAAHGGQVLVSETTRGLVEDDLPEGVTVRDVGLHLLKDIDQPLHLYQVVADGLEAQFPSPRTLDKGRRRLLRRRGVRLGLAAAAAVVAAGAAAAILLTTDSHGKPPAVIGSSGPVSVVEIDPKSGKTTGQLQLIGQPWSLAVGGLVWAANRGSGTLTAIDPRQHEVTKLVSVGGFPSALAVGEGAVWTFDSVNGRLSKIDTSYQTVAASARVAPPAPSSNSSGQYVATWGSIAAGEGAVWLTDGSTVLTEVDPVTTKVVRRIELHVPLDAVATGDGAVWTISGPKAKLFRLDRSGKVTSTIPIVVNPGPLSAYPRSVAVGQGYVWVLNGNTGTVTKVDPGQQTIAATIQASSSASGPQFIAVGNGAAWVGNADGTIIRVDAKTNAVTSSGPYAEYLHDIAVSPGIVWVTVGTSAENG